MTVQGLILAAGRGSRMGGLTETAPKCLAELAGSSLLSWQLKALNRAGLSQVAAVGGYKKQLLEPHVPLAAINEQWAETNMVRSLMCTAPLLTQNTCLISYSDIVYHFGIVATLLKIEADVAIVYDRDWESLWRVRFLNPLEDAETFQQERGWLTEIGGATENMGDIEGQYIGLLKFTPRGWGNIKEIMATLPDETVRTLDMTGLIRLSLAQGLKIAVAPIEGRWCEVDSQSDLDVYETCLAKAEQDGTKWSHDWRW